MATKIKGSWVFEPFEKFGEWTVLSNERKKEGKSYYVQCECSCGHRSWVLVSALINGSSKSCNTNKLYHSSLPNEAKKLIGKRIGKLVIQSIDRIEIDEKKKYHKIYYKCLCDCGNETIVHKEDLVRARPTISCGCEQIINKNEKMMQKQGIDFKTKIPLAEKSEPNKGNKLRQRNIHQKGGRYIVRFTFRKQRVYEESFKELEDAIEARDEFRDNELKEMIEEIKAKLQNKQ